MNFHNRLPEYKPSALHSLPGLAATLGIKDLYVKDESYRLTLPAFKILGASWAVYRWLQGKLKSDLEPWVSVADLRDRIRPFLPLTLVTATDGNHGRGVACMAKWLGLNAEVYMPRGTVPARIHAIESEGAIVTMIDGSYDEAVKLAASREDERYLLLQDTAWPGYETIPAWIVEGYATLLWEIEDALAGQEPPDLVFVPVGVGSLAAAMVRHYRRHGLKQPPHIISVEPVGAACLLESVKANASVTVPEGLGTIMAGLNCGTLSTIAWPILKRGVNIALEIEDHWAENAMEMFKENGITSGESGASSMAGLLALLQDESTQPCREYLGLNDETRVLLISTEGMTNPER